MGGCLIMTQELIDIFGEIAIPAFQIALVFGFGGKIIKSFLRMAFGGEMKF